ncbi:hypothetical protein CLOM_g21529, partial [Closterium sp. NIES-68]
LVGRLRNNEGVFFSESRARTQLRGLPIRCPDTAPALISTVLVHFGVYWTEWLVPNALVVDAAWICWGFLWNGGGNGPHGGFHAKHEC